MNSKWIEPATHNRNPVRVTLLIVASALAARGSLLAPGAIAKFVHLLAFSTWIGSSIWTTFFAGIIMFKNLPRHNFGKVQAKLFPAYFFLHAVCLAIMLVTLQGLQPGILQTSVGVNLGLSLASTLINLYVVEPESTRVMFKRYALESKSEDKSDAYAALASRFGKLHGISSLLNLGATVGACVYLWRLAMRIAL